jgi:hypothetical protein
MLYSIVLGRLCRVKDMCAAVSKKRILSPKPTLAPVASKRSQPKVCSFMANQMLSLGENGGAVGMLAKVLTFSTGHLFVALTKDNNNSDELLNVVKSLTSD